MDYRGPDLDLKSTRLGAPSTEARRETSGTPPAASPARPANVHSGPIWVSETVIACANHAFDVALAYRAAEVSLTHLLLAMTRVDTAAAALDARGIRVGALRRECAVAIAGEPAAVEAGVSPRGAPELEDVLRLASSRASHAGRAATVDDVVQALADIGGDLPGGDLILRHVSRASRDNWANAAAPSRPLTAALGFELVDHERSAAPAGSGAASGASAAPSIDPALLQSILERLSTVERGLGERFSALEAAVSMQSPQAAADLSPLEKRLAAIEGALSARGEGDAARPLDGAIAVRLSAIDEALAQVAERGRELRPFDAELSQRLFAIEDALKKARVPGGEGERPVVNADIAGRLAAIERALDDERVDRADGITALSDEITGVRSAVRLAAQAAEQAHAGQHEQAKLLAAALERNRIDFFTGLDRYRSEITAGVGDRIADIERWLNGNADRMTAAQAAYSEGLNGVHAALVRLGTTQHTLASALDSWHDDESGEIELINSRIGALHEGGVRRHAAIEKLSADFVSLAQQLLEERGQRGGFRRWLYGTEDWIKASWRKVTAPQPDGGGRGRFGWDFWRRREEG